MRFTSLVITGLLFGSSAASAQDASRTVAEGGIKVAGWQGKIDPGEASRGGKLEGAKLEKVGNDLHVTTGPAVAYWNPSNVASGNYTVKATFTEEKYMGLNNHPHPYGVFIGGDDIGTGKPTDFYFTPHCDGPVLLRGLRRGPAVP